jgi:hypothetical protein
MTGAVLDRYVFASGWNRGRMVALSGLGLSVLLLFAGLVAMVTGGAPRIARTARGAPGRPAALPAHPPVVTKSPSRGLVWHAPPAVTAPGTPVQEEYDQSFAQGLGEQPGMATATALSMPGPAVAGGWPVLAPAYTPESWAQEFVSGLVDVDFAHQSRGGLEEWLQANEAPEVLPGVPPAAADKMLNISLLDPGIFGGQPTPVPSATEWAADARAGEIQVVRGLLVQPDPSWAEMVAAGWQPADARMTEEDVSGVLTTRHGTAVTVRHFRLQLMVGSGRWRDGYGSVTVGGWAED